MLDNGQSGTSAVGVWSPSSGPSPYGANSLYSKSAATTYSYQAKLAAGKYEVLLWWTTWPSRPTAAPVTIAHAAGTATANVNQTVNGGRWNSIGTYDFGTSGKVTITSVNTSFSTCADAVCFNPVGGSTSPTTGFVIDDGTTGTSYEGAGARPRRRIPMDEVPLLERRVEPVPFPGPSPPRNLRRLRMVDPMAFEGKAGPLRDHAPGRSRRRVQGPALRGGAMEPPRTLHLRGGREGLDPGPRDRIRLRGCRSLRAGDNRPGPGPGDDLLGRARLESAHEECQRDDASGPRRVQALLGDEEPAIHPNRECRNGHDPHGRPASRRHGFFAVTAYDTCGTRAPTGGSVGHATVMDRLDISLDRGASRTIIP